MSTPSPKTPQLIVGNEALNQFQPIKHGIAKGEALASFSFDALTKRIVPAFRQVHASASFLRLGPAEGGRPTALLPIDYSIPFGAKKARVSLIGGEGEALPVSTSGGRLPVVSVTTGDQDLPYEAFGLAVEMTYEDMQAIEVAGDLGAAVYDEALMAVRRGMDKYLNNVLWYGSRDLKLEGVLSHTAIPKQAVGTQYVSGSNVETILAQTNTLIRSVAERSKGVFVARYCTMSNGIMTYLSSTYKEHSDKTLLSILRDSNPNIIFQEAWELESVSIGGTDLGRCIMVHDRALDYGRAIVSNVQALPFQSQKAGLEMVMPILAKTAGIVIPQPLSMSIYTNG